MTGIFWGTKRNLENHANGKLEMVKSKNNVDNLNPLNEAPFGDIVREFETQMGQNNRVFLIGAGCSRCAKLPLMSELTESVLNEDMLGDSAKRVLSYLKKQYEGGHGTTIEDYMSDITDIMAIVARRQHCGAKNEKISLNEEQHGLEELENVLNEIKSVMVKILEPKVDIATHREFVRTVTALRTGKSGHGRVDYFVLNYDTLIEDALALECLDFVDGFAGGAVGWWDASVYGRNNVGARVFKVHGSIDWRLLEGDPMPRRMRGKILLESIKSEVRERVMIWPAATKYRETQRDPFAQILELMRLSLNPKQSQEVILTICGYRFADMHINVEIDRALRESQKRLNILIFTEEDEPVHWLKRWFEDKQVNEQVRIHAKRGFFHGGKVYKTDQELAWWKFENIVRLLGGEK